MVSAAVSPLNARSPRQHLVEHGAERKHVGAMIDGQAAHLLRRHVAERAEHDAGVGRHARRRGSFVGAGFDRLGETEVENLDVVVARDHHVLGLQVAMHDAARVGGGDAARDLQRVGDGPPRRQRRRGRARARSVSPSTSSVTTNAVPPSCANSKIERMFGWESFATLIASRSKRARASGSAASVGRENLDGDLALEARVAGAIDLAHPAGAERPRGSRSFRGEWERSCRHLGTSREPDSCVKNPPRNQPEADMRPPA